MTEGFEARVRRIVTGDRGFAEHVGTRLDLAEPGHVRVRLPYRQEVSRGDELVQGGAIATLVDIAGTAAAWCVSDLPEGARGATVGFSLSYLEGGRGDLVADARVVRRGRRLVIVQVDVYGARNSHVATAQLTYSLTAPPTR